MKQIKLSLIGIALLLFSIYLVILGNSTGLYTAIALVLAPIGLALSIFSFFWKNDKNDQ